MNKEKLATPEPGINHIWSGQFRVIRGAPPTSSPFCLVWGTLRIYTHSHLPTLLFLRSLNQRPGRIRTTKETVHHGTLYLFKSSLLTALLRPVTLCLRQKRVYILGSVLVQEKPVIAFKAWGLFPGLLRTWEQHSRDVISLMPFSWGIHFDSIHHCNYISISLIFQYH